MNDLLSDVDKRLETLRDQGAAHYDPMRFHYLESLARRGAGATLSDRLPAFEQDFQQARHEAEGLLEDGADDGPHRARLQALYDAGDYKAVRRLARQGGPRLATLTDLTHRLRDHGEIAAAGPDTDTLDALLDTQHRRLRADQRGDQDAPRRELKTLATLQASRARQHTARRIRHAVDHPTGDAGPLNAHRQVVRALERLHTIAPGYLERFVGYVDTLMALEKAAPKNTGGRDL
ncbi:DUF2894 domain-containing protein [Alloalcanivorax sp. C16-1]|uniref:DUF2894 domain-containing protein n=1 Tax=Alloalcanivorax sp. C16-1 TaxID=3390051 RepID=UPI0039710741